MTVSSLYMIKYPKSPFSSTSSFCKSHRFSSEIDVSVFMTPVMRSLRKGNFKGKLSIGRVRCKFEDSDGKTSGEEAPESLFMKELKRRGINPTSLLEERDRTATDEEVRGGRETNKAVQDKDAASADLNKNLTNQREQSMALNSEGIEGLIPRAKLLLGLGSTFFLGFGPLILVSIASFVALYLYFGPAFVHDASKMSISAPQYIDPYMLLEDERIS